MQTAESALSSSFGNDLGVTVLKSSGGPSSRIFELYAYGSEGRVD
ncbi:MAG: hypothetical protein ACOX6P_09750 [Candidatus Merdivicinus sp.]